VLHVLPSVRPTQLVAGHLKMPFHCALFKRIFSVAYIAMKVAVNNKLKGMWLQQAVSAQSGACPVCLDRTKKITKLDTIEPTPVLNLHRKLAECN
jgi:hypothetical protein